MLVHLIFSLKIFWLRYDRGHLYKLDKVERSNLSLMSPILVWSIMAYQWQSQI